ncbi:MAG: glycoside hydrolase family 3 N-terminal domain-containing protein, partial [Pseudomonadota bacterium]
LDLISRLMASDLRACGINTNCAPVLDVIQPGAHDVIGDRAYGNDPATVTALGQVFADAHMASGIVPVMKHIPGHGRAPADSHVSLPVVDAPLEELVRTDFLPFETLRQLPAAMVGHVLYTELDPAQPASTSAPIVQEVIRHHVGFDGLLIADDVGMGALEGTMRERTARVLAAGLDLALHCNGALEEMEQVAEAAGPLGSAAQARYTRALSLTTQKHAFDRVAAMAILSEMMVQAA